MKAFSNLFTALNETNKTTEKSRALVRYFESTPPADAAWTTYFLLGRKLKRLLPSRQLATWAVERAGVSDWLFDECYSAVGDLAETIALLLPVGSASSELPLHEWVENRLTTLRSKDADGQRQLILSAWSELDEEQRLVWNKLITGGFRVGVSGQLVTKALATCAALDPAIVAHRLMGNWEPTADFFTWLISPESTQDDLSRPYPFFLAHPLEVGAENLGDIAAWQVEWKWDGIRAQLIRRSGRTFLWSRGEENVTERFPELEMAARQLPPGTVLDGEILPWIGDRCLPFAQLQRRIGRKTLGKKILTEVPVVFLAYDLVEADAVDIRETPLAERRHRLERIVSESDRTGTLRLSPIVRSDTWQELATLRATSRERLVEGLMLKRLDSAYRGGRHKGDWWKWKIEPLTVDAVLIYAQPGHGKRASLFTDYTFGVWDDGKLVSFAKAYSGLTDAEIRDVDEFVRKNSLEKFGPVRTVKPELVFELAFEGIQRSPRHKSGIAVRFPRIARWRKDKLPADADSLDRIKAMLDSLSQSEPAQPADESLA